MKYLLSLLLAASPIFAFTQGEQTRIPLQGATELHIYGNMSGVLISTGGTEIVVNHVLTVAGEERADLKELMVVRETGSIKVVERSPSQETLEKEFGKRGLSVTHRPGGDSGDYHGTKITAYLEITVPAGVKITAETKYGGIVATGVTELPMAKSVYGPIEVVFAPGATINGLDYRSDYQSVDVTLPPGIAADLYLSTSYGSLYTDFDFKMRANTKKDCREEDLVQGVLNGGGRKISLVSPYQNVYLRKL